MAESLPRRDFLRTSAAAALSAPAVLRAQNNNDKLNIGWIGVGTRGYAGLDWLHKAVPDNVAVTAICDTYTGHLARAKDRIQTIYGIAPKTYDDYRQLLADKSIDAVFIMTPEHLHHDMTIAALRAGKNVYIEKPLAHTIEEGFDIVNEWKKSGKIVQVGTQNRSAPYNMAARKYIEEGKLGKIHFCRVYNQKEWNNFPTVPDSNPPQAFDWDMWNGPAPQAKFNTNFVRNWNHFWRYSGGDIINDGIHQLDLARWVVGVDYPSSVYGTGGRYDSTGAAETPDTQIVTYQFPKMVMTFELTLYTPYMHKIAPVIRQSKEMFPFWPQCATRIEIYGSSGVMYLARHGGGWQVFGPPKLQEGVCVARNKGLFPDPEHKENFFQAIRTRKTPNADVEEGHRSTLLAHYGNISCRLGGQKLVIDRTTEHIIGNEQAMALFKRTYRKPWVIEENI